MPPTDKKRRLAAIMFADIVGYTAMMQHNESEGLASVHRFSEVMEAQANAYNGEVLEFRGDGCMVVFDSAVEAVHAAKAIQEALRQRPAVPLRIGIHIGDIVFTQGNIYGDGVNLASRVESMGIPGSILVTERVIHDVKSHPEFEMTSLGRFQFKNVEKPMEVFALANEGFAVPRPEEMKGKGEKVAVPKSSPRTWLRFASIGFLAMALGATLFWAVGLNSPEQADRLSKKIKEERVAIIPFNNRTSDSNLEVFGAFCSDLITNGLTEAGIKTCSPRTIEQYNHLIGVLPNNPEDKPSFSEVVGAPYWVEGYFSQVGDTLTIQSHLTDGSNGDIVRNFPEVKGHIDNKEGLVDELARRLMSYWVAQEEIEKGKFKPPLYEAYQEYRKISQADIGINMGEEALNDIRYGRRAFEKDPTFYLAALRELSGQAYTNGPRADTLIALLNPHYHEMTSFEQTIFDAIEAFCLRDYDTYGSLLGENYERFPRDPFMIYHYSFTMAFREARPTKAWEIANQVKLEDLDISPSHKALRIANIAIYGLGAGEFEAVIKLVDAYPRTKEWLGRYFHFTSKALVRSGKLDALEQLAKEVETAETSSHNQENQYDLAVFCNEVAEELLLLGQEEQAQKWLHKALEWVPQAQHAPLTLYDSLHLLRTNYLLGRYEEAVLWGEEACQGGIGWLPKMKYKATLGAAYARLGQTDQAETMIQRFLKNPKDLWRKYPVAQIYAELGKKEQVMDLLREMEKLAGVKGVGYAFEYAQYDYLMRNLFDYPPFVELMWIRDEELKD